ncbi:TonB family protein [Apibacter raozihei]|uniref:TonB family protein n=1 Tax=Apibacter raozihei TaxID=2500547 RepID=UPI0013E403E3|nr:TonB family protein [Apibacter raozihei]
MRPVYSFFLTLLLSCITYGQKKTFDKYDVIINYNSKKGKYGLITHKDKIIISPTYDYIKYFADEQVALAKKKFKWCFIVLPAKQKTFLSYEEIKHFNGPLFIVVKKGKYGLIDKYGKEVLSPFLDKIYNPSYGLAITKKDNFYGLLNLNGEIVASAKYDNIQLLDDTSYLIVVNNKFGVIKENGSISINPQFDNIYSFNKNLYRFINGGKYGLISKDGKVFVPAKYDLIFYNENNDTAYASLDDETGIISLLDGKFTNIKDIPSSIPMVNIHDKNKVFTGVANLEGTKAFQNFIKMNLNYPIKAIEKKTKGTVLVKFVVEKDGTISNIKIIRDIGDGCGEEVIRVLKLIKKWKPDTDNGKAVQTHYKIPIRFNTY